jgi:hypothetical protein
VREALAGHPLLQHRHERHLGGCCSEASTSTLLCFTSDMYHHGIRKFAASPIEDRHCCASFRTLQFISAIVYKLVTSNVVSYFQVHYLLNF